jgi:NADH dehydrogenase
MSELPQGSAALQRIVVLGAGFAGLWSAIGAARKLDELGIGRERVEVTLVDRSTYHSIRVRNYEAELDGTRVLLDDILRAIGVRRVEAEVSDIDLAHRRVILSGDAEPLAYDRLVLALGSRLVRPPLPGLDAYAFDVDTYDGARRLTQSCPRAREPPASGRHWLRAAA